MALKDTIGHAPRHEGPPKIGRRGLFMVAGSLAAAGGGLYAANEILKRVDAGVPSPEQQQPNIIPSTATSTVTREPTQDPTETGTPRSTETATATPTTDTQTPTAEPTDTRTATETPEPTKTPEPIDPLNEEFVNNMYDVLLNKIDWSKYGLTKELIQKAIDNPEFPFGIKQEVERKQPTEVLTKVKDICWAAIGFDLSKDEPLFFQNSNEDPTLPEDLALIKNEILDPLTKNSIDQYKNDEDATMRFIDKTLLVLPTDFVADRWKQEPFNQFIAVLENAPGFSEKDIKGRVQEFKVYIDMGSISSGGDVTRPSYLDWHPEFFCDNNNGSERDIYMRDKFLGPLAKVIAEGVANLAEETRQLVIPYIDLMPEGMRDDFTLNTKLQAGLIAQSCGVSQ